MTEINGVMIYLIVLTLYAILREAMLFAAKDLTKLENEILNRQINSYIERNAYLESNDQVLNQEILQLKKKSPEFLDLKRKYEKSVAEIQLLQQNIIDREEVIIPILENKYNKMYEEKIKEFKIEWFDNNAKQVKEKNKLEQAVPLAKKQFKI